MTAISRSRSDWIDRSARSCSQIQSRNGSSCDPAGALQYFSLVSSRYERASMIVTSNKPFSAWGEIFGDDMAATAMIDRLIHRAEILDINGTQV